MTLQKGGIQLVIEIEGDNKAQVAKANQAGLAVQALSRWRIASTGKGGILLSLPTLLLPKWQNKSPGSFDRRLRPSLFCRRVLLWTAAIKQAE